MLSVIIVAHNQHGYLHAVLASLDLQATDLPEKELEIVIVDNGSSPPIERSIPDGIADALSVRFVTRCLERDPFRPASARNLGVALAKGDVLLFLDGDCIPGPSFLSGHWSRLQRADEAVITLGHRVFVDGEGVTPALIRAMSGDLDHLPQLASASNYGLMRDRRMPELEHLGDHPMPFNCCHGCNLGVRRMDLPAGDPFDVAFDGTWGYEDIEFGYRMWREGMTFAYLPNAYVYHLERGGLSGRRRRADRRASYALACEKIPAFHEFRVAQGHDYYVT